MERVLTQRRQAVRALWERAPWAEAGAAVATLPLVRLRHVPLDREIVANLGRPAVHLANLPDGATLLLDLRRTRS